MIRFALSQEARGVLRTGELKKLSVNRFLIPLSQRERAVEDDDLALGTDKFLAHCSLP